MNTPNRTQWTGLFRALVIDDRDPLFKMRVKVRIPDFMVADEQKVGKWGSNGLWASPGNNYLGGRSIQDTQKRHQGPDAFYQGSCLIPPKGTHVWCWFEKNDISHPFYGPAAEYGDGQALPENQLGQEYQKKWTLFKSCQGRAIVFSDDNDDARVEITGKKRKITNPPFGDINSVYTIDDNQTVFLIDERRNHEKILLKDYRGNFIKLTQDEGGENDQLHIHMKNDIHIETMRNFYLTVAGDMHVKVIGSFYLTALQKINIKAIEELKEAALSFDRYSDAYDNTHSGNVNITSLMNINMKATMDIFQNSIRNIRNSMVTSDVSTGLTSINAGGAIGLFAGGAVSIYGYGGTAIQSTPISFPLTGLTNDANSSSMATDSKPVGKRNEIIKFSEGAPVLTTPTGNDNRDQQGFDHEPIDVSQCASSKVGQEDPATNNPAKGRGNNQSSSTCCGGGKGSQQPQQNPITTIEQTPQAQSIGQCCGGTASDILSNVSNADDIINKILEYLLEIKDKVSDNVFSQITGTILNNPELWDDYSIEDLINELVSQYSMYESLEDDISQMGTTIENDILDDIDIDDCDFDMCGSQVSAQFEQQYQEVTGSSFIDGLLNTASNLVNGTISSLVPAVDEFSNGLLSTVLANPLNTVSIFDNGIYDFVGTICDSLVNNGLSSYQSNYYQNVGYINNYAIPNIDRTIHEPLQLSCFNISKSINDCNDRIIDKIRSDVDINIRDKNIIRNSDVTINLRKIETEVSGFINKCKNNDEIKDDPDLIDTYFDELVSNIKDISAQNTMSETDKDKLNQDLNNGINDKLNSNLRSVLRTVNPDDVANYIPDISKIIKNELESNSYLLMSYYSDMTSEISGNITNDIVNDLKSNSVIRSKINEIETLIRSNPSDISVKIKTDELFNLIKDKLNETGYLNRVVDKTKITQSVNNFTDLVKDKFPSSNNNVLTDKLKEYSDSITNVINRDRKDNVNTIFTRRVINSNEFSKHDPNVYVVPNHCGCGYDNLLFLKDKYRNTIAPLISNSGGDVLAFSIIKNIDNLVKNRGKIWVESENSFKDNQIIESDEEVELLDSDAVNSYLDMLLHTIKNGNIDTTTKWWQNLKDVLNRCSILNITVIMTLTDFRDSTSVFLKGNENDYTDSSWDDSIQGKFFKTLFDVCKESQCNIIYNLGYGSYKNSFDEKNEKYQIYPNCGYLRRFILWCVYKCGISSNNLALTANKDDNLYYYNPYCEWKSYDDTDNHRLVDSELIVMDCVDGKTNDESDIVQYDYTNTIIGGYANQLVTSEVHSLPIFSMQNLKSKITESDNVKNPNIMSKIFCNNSRTAIRHFKVKDIENWKEFEFDQDGEVI